MCMNIRDQQYDSLEGGLVYGKAGLALYYARLSNEDTAYKKIYNRLVDDVLTKVSDKTIVEGLMMLTPYASDSTEPDVVAFVSKYKEKYNADPNQFAADGYDAIYVII